MESSSCQSPLKNITNVGYPINLSHSSNTKLYVLQPNIYSWKLQNKALYCYLQDIPVYQRMWEKEKSIPLYEFNIYICTYIDNLLQLFQTSHKHVFFLSHQLPKEFHLWAIPTIILKVKYQNNQWNNKESTHLFNLNLLRMRARASTLRVLHTHEEYACFFVCI